MNTNTIENKRQKTEAESTKSNNERQKVVINEFGGPEVLQLINEKFETNPKKGLLIEVLAVGVGFADIMAQRGGYFRAKKKPVIPGYDLVGQIVNAYDSTIFKSGDKIAALLPAMCTYQDKIQIPEKYLVKIPDNLPLLDAAAVILNYITACSILEEKAKVKKGDTVLIHGASGGVGAALAQIGKLKGLKMYGTASSAKHNILKEYGVIPIDYKTENFVEVIQKQQPNGIDAAFDAMGAENIRRSAKIIKKGGTIVSYGFSGNNYGGSGELIKGLFQFMKLKVLPNGIKMKVCAAPTEVKNNPEWYRKTLSKIFQQMKENQLKPIIDSVFPLSEVIKAHELMESGKARGKVVLTTKYFEP